MLAARGGEKKKAPQAFAGIALGPNIVAGVQTIEAWVRIVPPPSGKAEEDVLRQSAHVHEGKGAPAWMAFNNKLTDLLKQLGLPIDPKGAYMLLVDMAVRKPTGTAADRAETFHQVLLGPLAHPGANALNQLMEGEIAIKAA